MKVVVHLFFYLEFNDMDSSQTRRRKEIQKFMVSYLLIPRKLVPKCDQDVKKVAI